MAWTNIPDKSTGDLMDETWYDTHFKANMEELKSRTEDLPTRATMWHDEATVTSGNAIAYLSASSVSYGGLWRQNTPANGDSFTHAFHIKAGTYTIYWLGRTNTDCGKVDWSLDGTDFETGQDWYGSNTYEVVKSASLTIAEDGKHVLRGTVNGKNASSSDYAVYLTKYWIKAASD